jgi:hypothetical protein
MQFSILLQREFKHLIVMGLGFGFTAEVAILSTIRWRICSYPRPYFLIFLQQIHRFMYHLLGVSNKQFCQFQEMKSNNYQGLRADRLADYNIS